MLSLANQYPPLCFLSTHYGQDHLAEKNITELYGRVESQNKEGENLTPTQKLAPNGLSVEK